MGKAFITWLSDATWDGVKTLFTVFGCVFALLAFIALCLSPIFLAAEFRTFWWLLLYLPVIGLTYRD